MTLTICNIRKIPFLMVDLDDPPSLTKQEINTKPKRGGLVNVSLGHYRHLYYNHSIVMRH